MDFLKSKLTRTLDGERVSDDHLVFNTAFVRAIDKDLRDLVAPPQIMACTDPNCGCGMRATGVFNAVRLSLQLEENNENLKALTKHCLLYTSPSPRDNR